MASRLPLEAFLIDFAVIRTTFETLDVFPGDKELRAEMGAIISEARESLVRRLGEAREAFAADLAGRETDLYELREFLLHLMTRGCPGRVLSRMMRLDAFDEGAVYRLELPGLPPVDALRSASPSRLLARLIDVLQERAKDPASYASKWDFDRAVFQPYVALPFAVYAAGDPLRIH